MSKRSLGWLLTVAAVAAMVVLVSRRADRASKEPLPQAVPVAADPLDFTGLADADYHARFTAAMELLTSAGDDFDARLGATLAKVPAGSSARDSLEFLEWKVSGEGLPGNAMRAGDARPNVLLISIDTLRADHLGTYGYERPTSPRIDAFASEAVVFENAFTTAPWTLPGHMSIFTSLYPSFHKLESGRPGGALRLDASETTLSEALQSAGYRTVGFVTHPFLASTWGFGRGFDLYARPPMIVRAESQTDSAIAWLEWHLFHAARGEDPSEFFMFLHYMDPHETYDAPAPFGTRFTKDYQGELQPEDHLVTMFLEDDFASQEDYEYALALYDGEISYVDHEVGRLFDWLRSAGLMDATMIVLTSDHGEEFKEHGSMGHKSTLHTEQLHVPLIIRYAEDSAQVTRVATQASLVDIFPTIAAATGIDLPARAQGVDLRAFSDDTDGKRGLVPPQFSELAPMDRASEIKGQKRSIRTDKYKLIFDFDESTRKLYDVRADPREQRDLYPSKRRTARVRALQEKLEAHIRRGAGYVPGSRKENRAEVSEDIQAQLRALGYIE